MGSTGAARSMRSSGNMPVSEEAVPVVGVSSLSEIKTYIIENFDRVEVPLYDKWGDQFDTHIGFRAGDSMADVTQSSSGWVLHMGRIPGGFVAANTGLTENEAWNRLYNYLMKRR